MISQFDEIITQAIANFGVIPGFNFQDTFALVNAVIKKESSFDPQATSPTGQGLGLMQVNPYYWGTYVDLYDPYTNVSHGLQILREYISKYGVGGGLGAYFAGPAKRFTQAAKYYAQTVMGFFSGFREKVMQLFNINPGEYFIDQPGSTIPQIDINNLSSFPMLEPSVDISSYLATPDNQQSYLTQTSEDYSWLYIAAGVILILAVMQNA